MSRYTLLLLFVGFMCITSSVYSQNSVPINKLKSIGLLVNWPIIEESLPEGGAYNPTIIQGNLRFPLLTNETRHQVTLLVQPQYNPVKDINGQTGLFEVGVNFGIAYEYLISPDIGIWYLGLGVGPHYVNVQTDLQADGFIFSDNFFTGFHQFVGNRSWFLTYEFRFRHISNAGLQSPNGGIDNFFLGFGVSYFLF